MSSSACPPPAKCPLPHVKPNHRRAPTTARALIRRSRGMDKISTPLEIIVPTPPATPESQSAESGDIVAVTLPHERTLSRARQQGTVIHPLTLDMRAYFGFAWEGGLFVFAFLFPSLPALAGEPCWICPHQCRIWACANPLTHKKTLVRPFPSRVLSSLSSLVLSLPHPPSSLLGSLPYAPSSVAWADETRVGKEPRRVE